MKYLLIILLSINLFAKDILEKEVDKNFTKEDISEMNKLYTITNVNKVLPTLEASFIKETGDKAYQKYLMGAIQDTNWKKANYSFSNKIKKDSYLIFDGKKEKVNTPEYELSLEYFAKSAEEGNILSAYQGLKILEKFMLFGANKLTKEYQNIFAKKLMEKDYCIGYLAYASSKGKDFEQEPDYKKIVEILNSGEKSCKNNNIPFYYGQGLQHQKAKVNTYMKIRELKEVK